jgi:hypothetical protein
MTEQQEGGCFCSYCDIEVTEMDAHFCQPCSVATLRCTQCREPLPRDSKVCPHCGAETEGEKAQKKR